MVPGYALYPACFQDAIPKLVASVIHHHEWLEQNLHKSHPYFQSYIYRNQLGPKLKKHVLTGIDCCEITGMRAAGIPDSVYLTIKVDKVAEQFEMMEAKTLLREKDMLSKTSEMAAEAIRVQKEAETNILEAIDDFPKTITEEMLAHFEVNGALPVTMRGIKRMQEEEQVKQLKAIEGLQRQIVNMREDILQTISKRPAQGAGDIGNSCEGDDSFSSSLSSSLVNSPWKKYVYGTTTVNTVFGTKTTTVSYWLPQGYKFKAMTVKNVWDNWIHGKIADKIPPYWYPMVGDERDCVERE